MEKYMAIDLKEGKAVRLSKGLMDSAKIYSNEPWELAKRFSDAGAKWLHIVDLDGAFAGDAVNLKTIEKIVNATNLNIQIGGGVRNEERIKSYLNSGVSRLILGSVALKNPEFVKEMAKKYRIVVGIDAKDGFVAVEGWAEVSQIRATDLAKLYADAGVEAIIATDISKDGMLCGLNLEFTSSIAQASGIDTIASGGVASLADLEAASKTKGISGVIIGKAYYEGKIELSDIFGNNF
ncbi:MULTISPECIES: 1-(5-phosphoribosyl)-5-[(5-phosphoribosylamino)methylideneamino]imidazole-4-carboxamide isomerase [Campylobacter]|uniref:1-(5-phosphoribosyl)-5-[(5-phosphoribosylamino)methylideneamino] imidazole-4-carboxamide isomerase n=1 Tax=Campylobacter vicugnae TaxID=1660076 RepID=A0A1X9T016_9BACT|nr:MULTISPECIES: 1-(5-phosphoribosyl)-5-[(5-phosphoribosylamino)methylideneamino]imidazole-4-carboxamide isomerase [unclassified Campylobacter]ARR01830.1 N-(5'-phospho-L-ribosyl-formimino)-5-amino-1-(5'-phosphoribosyl)-4-imidazolecarboxamide isomerase [Campylobacter sp. RM8964]MBE6430417.1 1-(5-phosphoribosyl)-5-[(5-phosphoribosylamino)methylideneamino]imidazole-4-carboxamide isomerase [Campylobacter sp.]MBQ7136049.1 1-(5-phosphoribosyl)-5-[(5-phosphoribosylamino)methylideneamino]imidazole-4-car